MNKIVINTKKSIYKPILVEIDGKVFTVRRLPQKALEKLHEMDKLCSEGADFKAPYDRLRYLLNTTDGKIALLELKEVNAITTFILRQLRNPEKADPEKN
jgi:hypothetical protein